MMAFQPDTCLPRLLLLSCCLFLGACASVGYYGRTMSGHLEVMQSRRPVQEIMENEESPPALRDKLAFIQSVLEFAHDRLALPDNGSYRHYADLDRPFVAWNVFAAPVLSLKARRWCYLLVGCFSYRGYFEPELARQYAGELRQQGWDVYIGGVRAYSTLGWFRDPVLNTMLEQENWEIARLIFHELAHQKIYMKDHSDLNEAFAESVARIGLERWLQARPDGDMENIRSALAHEDAFFALILDYKDRLKQLYDSILPRSGKLREKQRILNSLVRDYQSLKQDWQGNDRFDSWIAGGVNNGKLVAISTYRRLVPDFMALYEATGRDLIRFYEYIDGLRDCGEEELQRRVKRYEPQKTC